MSIAAIAPEVGETRFVARVLTPVCPTGTDGRQKHYFRRVDGTWACADCGEPRGKS
jgi:hypothetical protein